MTKISSIFIITYNTLFWLNYKNFNSVLIKFDNRLEN